MRTKAIQSDIFNVGFNFSNQEKFIKDHGIVFEHYVAIPSPVGLKDRGDYARVDVDTFSSNGFLYRKSGEFTGVLVNNSTKHVSSQTSESIYDHSTARMVLPRFYNDSAGNEIKLLPGDRVYAKKLELKVDNYQKVEGNPNGVDFLQYPVNCVSFLIDSENKEYKQNVDFKITKDGNIKWKDKNPGIDPETGKGRVYSVRYTYLAFWYVSQLLNEIRITNRGTKDEPVRLPYQVMVQREYVYHNKNRSDKTELESQSHDERTNPEPDENIDPNQHDIKVDTRNFE